MALMTPLIALLLLPFAVGAVHRIWNHEELFKPVRTFATRHRIPIVACPSCNLPWIALGMAFGLAYVDRMIVGQIYLAFAVSGMLYLLMGARSLAIRFTPRAGAPSPSAEASKDPSECSTCQKGKSKKQALEDFSEQAKRKPKRILFFPHLDWTHPDALTTVAMIDAFDKDPDWFVQVYAPTKVDWNALTHHRNLRRWSIVLHPPTKADRLVSDVQQKLLLMGNGLIAAPGDMSEYPQVLDLGDLKAFHLLGHWRFLAETSDQLPAAITDSLYKQLISKESKP